MHTHQNSPDPHNHNPSALPVTGPAVALAEPITIRMGHNGFAGLTGRVVNIATDGSWCSARFINTQIGAPDKGGSLSNTEIRSVIAAINQSYSGYTFASLPPLIGAPHVNCPVSSISIGGDKKIAYIRLTPGHPAQHASAEHRAFQELALKLLDIVGVK